MGSSSTTTQKADPWEPAQPYILEGLDTAQQMFNSDPNQFVVRPWEGPAVADMSAQTQGAINQYGGPNALAQRQMLNDSRQNLTRVEGRSTRNYTPDQFQAGVETAQSVGPDARLNSATNRAMSATVSNPMQQGVAAAQHEGFDPRYANVMNSMTDSGYTEDMQNALRQNVMESVMPGMNQTFANSGMTGSSLHQSHLAKALASGMAPVEQSFVNQAQDRQFAAANSVQDNSNAAKERSLAAGTAYEAAQRGVTDQQLQAGQMSATDRLNRANMSLQGGQAAMDAYNTNQNRALSAIGMQPGMMEASYIPIDKQFEAGQYLDNRSQTQLAADIMADQQNQAGPIDAINNYLALTSGLGGQFGTSTASQSNNPGLLGILGGVAPILGGLFSDIRLKEDIRRVGMTDDGLPVYTYRYKGQPETHMGVMAQEVEQVKPEAVLEHPSGYKMVDYSQIGEAA